jgi:hypothetical protein
MNMYVRMYIYIYTYVYIYIYVMTTIMCIYINSYHNYNNNHLYQTITLNNPLDTTELKIQFEFDFKSALASALKIDITSIINFSITASTRRNVRILITSTVSVAYTIKVFLYNSYL